MPNTDANHGQSGMTAVPGELKPCPFCGGDPLLQEHEAHTHLFATFMPDHPGSWTIECCDVGMIKDTREEVIAAWNRRAAMTAANQAVPEGWKPALLLALYHHQGASSLVGQSIRRLLGIGQFDPLTAEQIAQATSFAAAPKGEKK
jgi:hypothetical protein